MNQRDNDSMNDICSICGTKLSNDDSQIHGWCQ